MLITISMKAKMLKNEYYVLALTPAAAILTFMLSILATSATSPWHNNLLRSVILFLKTTKRTSLASVDGSHNPF